MATELTIKVPNRAGQLAAISTTLADAGVNIASLAGSALGGKGIVHIVVADKDAARARRALKKANLRVATDRKLLEVRMADKPGALARVAKRLGTGRVSVDSAYLLGTGKRSTTIGFGVKDARKAKRALGR
ncbi:MAG: ACT domain-containing protein [Candidatus Limnocylindria bacterium]